MSKLLQNKKKLKTKLKITGEVKAEQAYWPKKIARFILERIIWKILNNKDMRLVYLMPIKGTSMSTIF